MSGRAKDGRRYTNHEAGLALGVDEATVKRWRSRGWILNRRDGSLDREGTLARARAHRDPTHGGRSDRLVGGADTLPAAAPVRPESRPASPAIRFQPSGSSGGGHDLAPGDAARLLKARAIGAAADAKLKQLRIQERLGELIPRTGATQTFADALAEARSKLETLPVRLAHSLVGLDAPAIRAALQAEVETLLEELSHGLDVAR